MYGIVFEHFSQHEPKCVDRNFLKFNGQYNDSPPNFKLKHWHLRNIQLDSVKAQ